MQRYSSLIPIFLTVFTVTSVYSWFSSHINPDWPIRALSFFLVLILTSLLYIIIRLYTQRAVFTVQLTPLHLLLAFVITSLLLFLLTLLPYLFTPDQFLAPEKIWLYTLVFLRYFLVFILSLVCIGSHLFITGELVARLFHLHLKEDSFSTHIKLAVGFSSWLFITFFLSLFGQLQIIPLISIGLLIAILNWKTLLKLFSLPFQKSPYSFNVHTPSFWILALCFVLFSLIAIDALRPIPTGFDDMTTYMNRSAIMAEQSSLFRGGANPFPFELLVAAVKVLTPASMAIAMGIGVLCLIFSFTAILGFVTYLTNKTVAQTTALVWLSLPMTSSLVVREVKPDTLLFFLFVVILWCICRWIQEKDRTALLLASFFFGLAVTVKLTALFFGGFFLITLFYHWPKPTRKRLIFAVTLLFYCLLPILPWLIYSIETRGGLPHSLTTALTIESEKPVIPQEYFSQQGLTCSPTGLQEDLSSYQKRPLLSAYMFSPWDISMNNRIGTYVSEVGFLFLALLPWLLVTKKGAPLLSRRLRVDLTLMAIVFWTSWFVLAKFVPWYGWPGFFFLCLGVAILLHTARPPFRVFLWSVFFVGILANTLVRLQYFANPPLLYYLTGALNADGFQENNFPGYLQTAALLNTKFPNNHILTTSSKSVYFIKNNDTRVIQDGYLDTFYCLSSEKNPAKTLERLNALNIQYIIFNTHFLSFLETKESTTLYLKTLYFTHFAKENLEPIFQGPDLILYKVKTPQP